MSPPDDWNSAIPLEQVHRDREGWSPPAARENGPPVKVRLNEFSPTVWHGKEVPERRWIVPGHIPQRNVTMLSGDGGLGKSMLALQLLSAVATSNRWLGMEVTPCRAIGLFCEDDKDELHRRQADINRSMGIEFADLDDLQFIDAAERGDVALATFDKHGNMEPTSFMVALRNAAVDFGAQLIVLDSLHNFFTGNENIRPQVWAFIRELRSLAIEIDGAVVMLAHPSVAGMASGSGSSGSTAWHNGVRSRLYLTRPDAGDGEIADPDARQLSTKKSNYGPADGAINLRWRDGVFERDDPGYDAVEGIERRNVEKVFLETLRKALDGGLEPSWSDGARGSYAPKMLASMASQRGFKVRDFKRAMSVLFDKGDIVLAFTDGPPSKRKKIVVPSDHRLARSNQAPSDSLDLGDFQPPSDPSDPLAK